MAELSHRRRRRAGLAIALALAFFSLSRESSAQLHWDASAQIGVNKRFMGSRPTGSPDASVGPIAQLTGHVALLPLVRVGAYFGHDISALGGDASARQITSGGLRVKGLLPWVGGSARAWLFAGFGYARVYSPAFGTQFHIPSDEGEPIVERVRVQGAGGGFFDVPFGVGGSYKLFKPWELVAELGARADFGHTGSLYDSPGRTVLVPGQAQQKAIPAGLDRFAVGLTIGVLVDF